MRLGDVRHDRSVESVLAKMPETLPETVTEEECQDSLECPVAVRVSDVATERVQWLWHGRLPRGKVVMLDGDPALGKSTLMLDLAARLTTGSRMPDGTPGDDPESVVLMTAEDGIADTVRPRLEAADADLRRVHVFAEVRLVDGSTRLPTIPGDLHHLETLVNDTGAGLVIVDVLNAYLSSKVDGYRDQDVRGALHPVAKLAERTGATVVALRHLSKSGGANAVYRGGGSIGIIGGARAGLLVGPDPDDESRRVLAVSKSNLAEKPPSLAYRLVNDDLRGVARVVWEGTVEHSADGLLVPREESGREDLDGSDVLASILADGPLWVAEAITAMASAGFTKDQARRAKDKVARSLKVGKPGDAVQGWQWALRGRPSPPEGGRQTPEDGEGGSSQNVPSSPSSPSSPPSLPPSEAPVPVIVTNLVGTTGHCDVCGRRTGRTAGKAWRCSRCLAS